jgi:hypothetical protein
MESTTTTQEVPMSAMSEQLTALMARVAADVAESEAHGQRFGSVRVAEMADGSDRLYALIDYYDVEHDSETQVRIAAPAPANAPRWARVHMDFEREVFSAESRNLSSAW